MMKYQKSVMFGKQHSVLSDDGRDETKLSLFGGQQVGTLQPKRSVIPTYPLDRREPTPAKTSE